MSKQNGLVFEPVASFLERTGFGRKYKLVDIRVCEVCGDSFTRVRGQFHGKRTCSKKCGYDLRNKNRLATLEGMHRLGLMLKVKE